MPIPGPRGTQHVSSSKCLAVVRALIEGIGERRAGQGRGREGREEWGQEKGRRRETGASRSRERRGPSACWGMSEEETQGNKTAKHREVSHPVGVKLLLKRKPRFSLSLDCPVGWGKLPDFPYCDSSQHVIKYLCLVSFQLLL